MHEKIQNIAFELIGRTIVTVYSEVAPSNTDIDEWIAFALEHKDRFKGILGYSQGGTQTAVQRKKIREAFPSLPPTAVLTNSTAARLAVTAFNLFVDLKVQLFSPRDLDGAFAYLKVPPQDKEPLTQSLARLQRKLGIAPL